MRKHARKKQRKRKSRNRPKRDDGPVVYEHPLSKIPNDQFRAGVIKAAQRASADFKTHLNAVIAVLRGTDPLQMIAMLATYGLFSTVSKAGKHEALLKQSGFTQAHVELAQALALTLAPAELSQMPPRPEQMQMMFDVLPELGRCFALQRMRSMEQERNEEQKAVTLVQEHLRVHTQNVRNWGYFDAVVRIVNELYSALDSQFAEHIGMSATQIARAFAHLIREQEREVNAAWATVVPVFREKSVKAMIEQYYSLNQQLTGSTKDLHDFAKRHSLTVDQTKALILAHSDYRRTDVFVFSAESLAHFLGIDPEQIKGVFDRLSLVPGDLAAANPDHLLLDNPVWRKPLIGLGNGEYFCAMPQMFFSFVRPILDGLIEGNHPLKQACEARRAKFLESEIAALFKRAFPGAEIVRGFTWRENNREYENDLLVRIDSHLLVVEAKSGVITWPALRGAPDRVKKHMDELIIGPSIQSARFADHLYTAAASSDVRAALFPELPIDLEKVRTVLRLSVTLEDFAMTQSNLHALDGTGWIPRGHRLAPCMLLTDLEVVFDILESPGQRLNYIRRRIELGNSLNTSGDELDHLGLYLSTGFNLGGAENRDAHLHLVGMSKEIDQYCVARAETIETKRPKVRIGKLWLRVCEAIEARQFDRWTDAYAILLSFSLGEQERAEKMFGGFRRRLLHARAGTQERDFVLLRSERKSGALALFAFREAESVNRHSRIQSIASQAFMHAHVDKCLVVAVNIDRPDEPYSTLVLLDRGTAGGSDLEELIVY